MAIDEGTQLNYIQHHWVHDDYLLKIVSNDLRGQQEYFFIGDELNINVKDLSCRSKEKCSAPIKNCVE